MQILLKAIMFFGLVVVSTRCISQQHHYAGRIQFHFYDNGELDTTLATTESYLYEGYVLEKIYSLKIVSLSSKKGSPPNPNKIYQIPRKYILTDLSRKQCVEIGLSDTTGITSKYPLVEKREGLKFFGDLPEIEREISNFKVEKDTMISERSYMILKDRSRFSMGDGFTVKEAIILFNKKQNDVPIHLISKSLDDKYKGSVTKLTYYFENNYKTEIVFGIDTYMSKQDEQFIKRYIQLYMRDCKINAGKK